MTNYRQEYQTWRKLLNKRKFINWLNKYENQNKVFFVNSSTQCPLAQYMQESLPYKINITHRYMFAVNEVRTHRIKLPEFFNTFVINVDRFANNKIDINICLQIIDKLE